MDDRWLSVLFALTPIERAGVDQLLPEVAGTFDVALTAMPDSALPSFVFLPEVTAWPEIHLALYGFNWRLMVIDQPNSYAAHWCFAGNGMDSFVFAVQRLAAWRGDPAGEPTGYVSKRDARRNAVFWPRREGQRLTLDDFPRHWYVA